MLPYAVRQSAVMIVPPLEGGIIEGHDDVICLNVRIYDSGPCHNELLHTI
jgi:hypothetical protein